MQGSQSHDESEGRLLRGHRRWATNALGSGGNVSKMTLNWVLKDE